jgi:membrane protein YqaA with SNARE-associated domain
VKKEKLTHYAQTIASHADAHWVTPFFFFFFLFDSFLMILPADSLLSATIALRPRHVKKWLFFSILGAIVGFGLLVWFTDGILHEYFLRLIREKEAYHQARVILEHAENYGLVELTVGVLTVLPCMIGAVAGVLVGLNPWAVFGIVVAAKIVRILLTVVVVYTGKTYLKKIINFYLKTSI